MDLILWLRNILWGPFTILLMLCTGLYLSIRTGFVQLWCIPAFIRQLRDKNTSKPSGISPLQALSTSLGGTLGIGNLAGVSVALTLGGAGAIFYMLLAAFLGMATKFSEIVLAVRFQVHTKDGQLLGGPMLYLSRGLGWHRSAQFFCVVCIAASLTMGAMTQTSALTEATHAVLPLSPLLISSIAAFLIAPVLSGGKSRIAAAASLIVPLLLLLYFILCGIALHANADKIPAALQQIVHEALHPAAMQGGILGTLTSQAVINGFAKGVFSNEAGLGSAPLAHGSAACQNAVAEGLLGAVEVFIDTCVICLLTALVVLTSGVLGSGASGLTLTTQAFSGVLHRHAPLWVGIMVVFLSITSVLGWGFYGLTCLRYLTAQKTAEIWYRRTLLAAMLLSTCFPFQHLLIAADIFAAPMAFPNLLALWTLAPMVQQETAHFLQTQKRCHGIKPRHRLK